MNFYKKISKFNINLNKTSWGNIYQVSFFSKKMILKCEIPPKIQKEKSCYELQARFYQNSDNLDRTSSFPEMISYLKSRIKIDPTQDVILLDEVVVITSANSSFLDSLEESSKAMRSFSKMILISVLCNDIDECMVGNYGVRRGEFVRIDFEKAGENKSGLDLSFKINQCIENALMYTGKESFSDNVYKDVLSYLPEFCRIMNNTMQDKTGLLNEVNAMQEFSDSLVTIKLEPVKKRAKHRISSY